MGGRPPGGRKSRSLRAFGMTAGERARDEERPGSEGGPYKGGSGLRQWRAAGEFGEGGVANILEVGDADFAGVEAVGGEIAQEGEEGHSLAEPRILFGVFAIGDEVEDFFFLLGRALHEDFVVAVRAGGIQPEEPAAKLQLIFGVFAGEQIDEFRRAGFHRAPGFFILGDDGIAQKQERRVLCDGKIFWRVRARRSSSLLLVHHLVDVLGGLRGNNLQHRASGRAEGEGAKDVAAGYGFVRHGGPHNGKRKDLTQGAQRTQRAHRKRGNGQWTLLKPVLSWVDPSFRDKSQHTVPPPKSPVSQLVTAVYSLS